tara:strand:+ start:369 stop:998 length:630 start_codon:yes stop_codon:yes gene_type:complete
MFLILDFTQSLRLIIVNKQKILFQKEVKSKKNISEILVIEIEKFLKKSKIKIKKIRSIYVITGPGSFTGVRSALTFAKSLRLILKIDIFGLSKFEIINYTIKINKYYKSKCIFLHFKDNQFFSQTFKGFKAVNKARLINFDNEELKLNNKTTYIYDSISFESLIGDKVKKKIKENLYLVDYNLSVISEIIENNVVDNNDPKPLYISDYF